MSKTLNHFNGDGLIGGSALALHDSSISAFPKLVYECIIIKDLLPH